jgi:hypothetical protein
MKMAGLFPGGMGYFLRPIQALDFFWHFLLQSRRPRGGKGDGPTGLGVVVSF